MHETPQDLTQRVAQLEAESAVRAQCHRYCRALDRADDHLLRSVFHSDATHEHGIFRGTSAQFCDYALETVRALSWTQHFLSNINIDVRGDVAQVESYFLAVHRLARGRPGSGIFSGHDIEADEDILIGGRYLDRFERRNGTWKIAHRHGINEWDSWLSVDSRHFPLPEQRS